MIRYHDSSPTLLPIRTARASVVAVTVVGRLSFSPDRRSQVAL